MKTKTIPDVQAQADERNLAINKVGIQELILPLKIQTKDGKVYSAITNMAGYTFLPAENKGTHMSRFIRLFNEFTQKIISYKSVKELLYKLKDALGSEKVYINLRFLYFLEKISPVSKLTSLLNYECFIESKLEDEEKIYYGVDVSIMSLCPASKAISKNNAHNQRGLVSVKVLAKDDIDFEKIIKIVEAHSSCEIYGLLKLEDEKYVTEKSYDNPKFVEDTVRDIGVEIEKLGFEYWKVSCENFESIHTHNAYAEIERGICD